MQILLAVARLTNVARASRKRFLLRLNAKRIRPFHRAAHVAWASGASRMFPAKIYVGQIAVVLGIVVVSTWGATQWTAAALGYQQRLGEPWFLIVGYRVYLPWRLFEWWFAYEAYAPEIFEEGGAIAAAGGIAGALFAIVNSVYQRRVPGRAGVFGRAGCSSLRCFCALM
jgi:hypothetical protein